MRNGRHRSVAAASLILTATLASFTDARAQFCDPPYTPRDAAVAKPGSWAIAGAYDVHTAALGNAAAAIDLDGNGSKELLIGGLPGTLWQAHGFVSSERGYEIVHAARPPFAFDAFTSMGSGWISSGRLHPGGPEKLFVGGPDFRMYDRASRQLEIVGALDPGVGRIWTVDIDHDGVTDLVSHGGVVLSNDFRQYKSLLHPLGGEILGNFDGDSNYEFMTASGTLLEWRDGGWREQAHLDTQSDRDVHMERGDVDADGIDELAYVINGIKLRVHDFVEQRTRWEAEVLTPQSKFKESIGVPPNAVAAIAVTDVTDDDAADVVVLTEGAPNDEGEVQAFDGRTGTKLWSFSHPDISATGLFVDNFDDDPQREIAFSTGRPVTGPVRIHIHDLQTHAREWMQREEGGPITAFALGELTAGAGPEVIVAPPFIFGEDDTRLYVRDTASMQTLLKLESALLPEPSASGLLSLAVGNVMGDAQPELVVGSDDALWRGRVYVYSWPARTLLRTFSLPADTSVTQLATADMDGDGDLEIVAGTGVQALPHVLVLDARANAILFDSGELFPGFGRLPGMKVADLNGDGKPEIVTSGADVVVIDGATRAITRPAVGPYYAVEIADANGDGKLDILAGRGIAAGVPNDAGRLDILSGPDWTAAAQLQVCKQPLNALAWNAFEPAKREVFFTCGSQIGLADLTSGAAQFVSPPAGVELGLSNHLYGVRTANGQLRLLTIARLSAFSFSPTRNIAPYLPPGNVCGARRFVKHWRSNLQGVLTFADADGDALTASVAHAPLRSPFEMRPEDGQALAIFGVAAFKGAELFAMRLSDGLDESPLALSALFVANDAPRIADVSITVRPGANSIGFQRTDGDGDDLVYEIVAAPAHGTLTMGSGDMIYTPADGYFGMDSFQLRAFDQVDRSEPITYSLQVAATSPTPPPPPPPPNGGGNNSGGGGGGTFDLWLLLMIASVLTARSARRPEPAVHRRPAPRPYPC